MNTITTTPRGNWLTRIVRRCWLGYKIKLLEQDIDFFDHEAKLMPLRAREYRRVAEMLRVEVARLQD